jgi:hypothetical protein
LWWNRGVGCFSHGPAEAARLFFLRAFSVPNPADAGCNSDLAQYSITPSLHHSITPSLHHSARPDSRTTTRTRTRRRRIRREGCYTLSRASARSDLKSSRSSTPTDKRTRVSSIPRACRCSGGIEPWVMMAGCSIKLSTPPRLSAKEKR